jgi:hypothetical protein
VAEEAPPRRGWKVAAEAAADVARLPAAAEEEAATVAVEVKGEAGAAEVVAADNVARSVT